MFERIEQLATDDIMYTESIMIKDLEMLVRVAEILISYGISHLKQLEQYSKNDLLAIPKLGKRSVDHIIEVANKYMILLKE